MLHPLAPRRSPLLLAALLAATPFVQAGVDVSSPTSSVVTFYGYVAGSSAPYGRAMNFNSFQASSIETYNGYQYTALWRMPDGLGRVTIARRPVGATAWEFVSLDSTIVNGPSDAHNVVSFGLNPSDGTIHLAYDMHGHRLRYRVTNTDVLSNPASMTWNASLFANEKDSLLPSNQRINGVTYPTFFREDGGDLQLAFRVGSSGNGSWWIYDYNGASGTWTAGRQIDTGTIGTYTGTTSNNSTTRNNYPNGFTYGPDGRLHSTFTWRESATGAANHDINYVYSDDNGVTWYNNAGQLVSNSSSSRFNLTSPGLVVRPLAESQSLMNQNGQGVDHAGRPHAIVWHRDSAKDESLNNVWEPQESSYFQYWRDELGNWHQSRIDGNVGARPKIFFDHDDNAIAIYTVKEGGVSLSGGNGSNLYFANGDLVIAAARKESNWTDWKIIATQAGPFVSEAQADAALFESAGILSVIMQDTPTSNAITTSPVRVFDFDINIRPRTNAEFAVNTGDFAAAVNWSHELPPAADTNFIINANRTATVSSDVGATLDGRILVGHAGSNGTLRVEAGTLDLLDTGAYGTAFGGSIVVGASGNAVGVYEQTGGDVSAWRFAVGDYFDSTSGGGTSSAVVSGGTLTTHSLEIGFSGTGSSSGSSFTVAGSGVVDVRGDVVVGEFGNAATLRLEGGSLTVRGELREGFNKTNNSTLVFDGGWLDMTNNSISLDNIEWNSGLLANVKAIQNGGVILKNTVGVMRFAGNNAFTNAIQIDAGAIRVESNNGLGTANGPTAISGQFTTGALELAGGVTIGELLLLGGRQPENLAAHVRSVSGNNVITSNLDTTVGGNQYNVEVAAGSLTINGNFDNNQTGGPGDTRFLNLGGEGTGRWNGTIADGPGASGSRTAVVKRDAGTWTLAGANSHSGVTIVAGGTLRMLPAAWNVLTNDGGVDFGDGSLLLDYTGSSSPAASVEAILATSAASGFVSGQFRSSTIDVTQAIGWLDNGVHGVLVRRTLPGDANLDRSVDFADLISLARSYGSASANWIDGDFDYNDVVDFADLVALTRNFGAGGLIDIDALDSSDAFAADAVLAWSIMPEPATIAVGVMTPLLLLRRQRVRR